MVSAPSHGPPLILTRNRIKQPHRNSIGHRYNPLPLLLHNQGHTRRTSHDPSTPNTSPILPRPLRRPRQLHPSQPTKYPSTYQTRVIFPICLCHPSIQSQQTGRSTSPSPIHPISSPYAISTHIKTAQHHIPTTQPMPFLTASHRPPNTNTNRRTAS